MNSGNYKKLLLSVLGRARRLDPARLGRPSRRSAEAHLGPAEPARFEVVASLAMPPPPLGRRAGHARRGRPAPIKPRPSLLARALAAPPCTGCDAAGPSRRPPWPIVAAAAPLDSGHPRSSSTPVRTPSIFPSPPLSLPRLSRTLGRPYRRRLNRLEPAGAPVRPDLR
jgi:hypothetical protein